MGFLENHGEQTTSLQIVFNRKRNLVPGGLFLYSLPCLTTLGQLR